MKPGPFAGMMFFLALWSALRKDWHATRVYTYMTLILLPTVYWFNDREAPAIVGIVSMLGLLGFGGYLIGLRRRSKSA